MSEEKILDKEKSIINSEENRLTKKDLVNVFIRSNFQQASWNYERIMALGYCFAMAPVVKRLYEGDEKRKAIKRHLEFFCTQPFLAAPILGITSAMEEQKANGADIDDATINGIKIGLMGPLAGVGDPVFWGTLRPVLAALGAGFALTGNIFGPILFFIVFNAIRLTIRWYGVQYGYKKGTSIVKDMGGNRLQKLTEGAAILGLFVMGALVSKWTNINIPLVVSNITLSSGESKVTTVQNVLDQLMPGLVPLLLTFICMKLLKKKVNVIWIIFGIFGIGILGYAFGILQ